MVHPHLGEETPSAGPVLRSSSTVATWMLLATTFLWGMSFSLTKTWQDEVAEHPLGESLLTRVLLGSMTLIVLRALLAVLLVLVFMPRMARRPSARAHRLGMVIGLVFFGGFALQIMGLAFVSPARSGFYISLSSLWVPVFAALWLGQRVALWIWAGMLPAFFGVFLLAGENPGNALGRFGTGDIISLGSTLFYGVQLMLIDHYARRVPSHHLTFGFLTATGLAGLVVLIVVVLCGPGFFTWWLWVGLILRQPMVPAALAGLVLITVLSFHWMSAYQPRVGASRAAIIYLCESAFAALVSVLLGYDPLSWRLVVSGTFIVLGNALAEMPNFLARWRLARQRRRTAGER